MSPRVEPDLGTRQIGKERNDTKYSSRLRRPFDVLNLYGLIAALRCLALHERIALVVHDRFPVATRPRMPGRIGVSPFPCTKRVALCILVLPIVPSFDLCAYHCSRMST